MLSAILRKLSFSVFTILAILNIGCVAGDGESSDDNPGTGGGSSSNDAGVTTQTNNLTSDSNGSASLTFNIPAGTTKFEISAESSGKYVRFEQIQSQSGTNYLSPGGATLSYATEFIANINSATTPSRDLDPNLNSSETFSARVTVTNNASGSSPSSNNSLVIKTHSRSDNNLSSGTLKVNMFFVGSTGQSESSKAAIESAITEFRRIYANAGISLDISSLNIDGSNLIPDPFDGSNFYLAATSGVSSPAVNIFIAGDVQGEQGTILGIAGGVPVPAYPSPRSALVVSIVTGAGADGTYSNEEIRLLGESLAHESGHYLGLFHPVELSGSSAVDFDPLSDTDTCSSKTSCVNNNSLAANLMFPQPVINNGTYVPQNLLTPQQTAVLNRYIAVN